MPAAALIASRAAAADRSRHAGLRSVAAVVSPVHIAGDDRNVLKPAIVAARINRDRPASGARYSVNSMNSHPVSFARLGFAGQKRPVHVRTPRPYHFLPLRPVRSTGPSNRTSTERSISETVIPTASTRGTPGRRASRSTEVGARNEEKRQARAKPHPCDTAVATPGLLNAEDVSRAGLLRHVPDAGRLLHTHPSYQVIADAQRIRHDRQRRIHRAAGREEARVDDI